MDRIKSCVLERTKPSEKLFADVRLGTGTLEAGFEDSSTNEIAAAIHQVVDLPEEFKTAHEEIKRDQSKVFVWQPIIAKYNPTLIGECQKSIAWSEQIAKSCLKDRMFSGEPDADTKITTIMKELGDHATNLSHARHLSAEKCKEMGLKVEMLEDNQELQDAVLTVHHALIHTLTATPACKVIENQNGVAFIQTVQTLIMKQ